MTQEHPLNRFGAIRPNKLRLRLSKALALFKSRPLLLTKSGPVNEQDSAV